MALETSGNWYWLVRAMEQAGLDPRLAHALEVKKRMPGRNKTDSTDAKGLAAAVAQRRPAGSLGSTGSTAGSSRLDAHAAFCTATRQFAEVPHTSGHCAAMECAITTTAPICLPARVAPS